MYPKNPSSKIRIIEVTKNPILGVTLSFTLKDYRPKLTIYQADSRRIDNSMVNFSERSYIDDIRY